MAVSLLQLVDHRLHPTYSVIMASMMLCACPASTPKLAQLSPTI